MTVTFVAAKNQQPKSKKRGHTRPAPPLISLDQPGRLRVGNLMAILAVSHSALYEGMASGKYPKPDGVDGRPFWNTSTVKAFLEG